MTDVRGIKRGKCKVCQCDGFQQGKPSIITCSVCNHPPAKHERLDDNQEPPVLPAAIMPSGLASANSVYMKKFDNMASDEEELGDDDEQEIFPLGSCDESSIDNTSEDDAEEGLICSYSNCELPAYFDINSGESSLYCEKHKDKPQSVAVAMTPSRLRLDAGCCKLPGCSNPCHIDPVSEKIFDFCCRSHGRMDIALKQQEALKSGIIFATQDGIPDDLKCTNPLCNKRKYQESKTVLDYCGITCRDLHRIQQQENPQLPFLIPGSNIKQCLLPGCKLARHRNIKADDDPSLKSFCGMQHRKKAEELGLLEFPSDHKKYKATIAHFQSNWSLRKSAAPTNNDIVAVFKIFNPNQKKSFTKYVNSLTDLSIQQFYHGTSVKCDMISKKCACTNRCGVCGIVRNGFSLKLVGSNIPRFMRFGKGFYLAPNSSKCHDYTQGIKDYRVMLLCDVAPGNKYTVQNDHTRLTTPPQGYDSVYGASGGNLNYDEIVLYRSESILPKYAIVYRRDGIGKIAK